MDWKVGDEFIIDGPDWLLQSNSWLPYKGTIQKILRIEIYGIYGSELRCYVANPKDGRPDIFSQWYVKPEQMHRLTKLHKALL